MSVGLPSTSAYELFIAGCAASALTTAKPIRWVNETLPPRPRPRWLLITMRLSMSSLAGTDRTLVAVGTARLAVMLVAVRAPAPRSRVCSASAAGRGPSVGAGPVGAGPRLAAGPLAAGPLAVGGGSAGTGAGAGAATGAAAAACSVVALRGPVTVPDPASAAG